MFFFYRGPLVVNEFRPKGINVILVITNTVDNSEVAVKLMDILTPLNTIYARCLLLDELSSTSIIGKHGLHFNYSEESIAISSGGTDIFTITDRLNIINFIEKFQNTLLNEYISTVFSHYRYKKMVIRFLNQLLEIFSRNKYTLDAFAKDLSTEFLNLDSSNYAKKESELGRCLSNFARNTIDAGSFDAVFHTFISKLIISYTTNLYKEHIKSFMENYSLM